MSRSTPWIIALTAASLACAAPEQEPAPEPMAVEVEEEPAPAPATATASLSGAEGSGISGSVVFTETAEGVAVAAHLVGAAPGTHGFHVHETGDCSAADFTSAGDHFNPAGVDHGGPDAEIHHAGDLGNIEIEEDGTGHLELTSSQLTVAAGEYSVVGRAVILHEGVDDLTSQPTGAAGARLACGVVAAGADDAAPAGAPGLEADGATGAEGAVDDESGMGAETSDGNEG